MDPFGRSRGRLAAAPDMFGDSYILMGMFAFTLADDVASDILIPGSVKIAENNRALPTDRFYVMYYHMHNGIIVSRFPPGVPVPAIVDSWNIDRFTVGIEKTLLCGCWSLELRMPFAGNVNAVSRPPAGAPDFTMDGGGVGNLAISLKRLLYRSPTTAISAGLGVTGPTGSDARGTLPARGIRFTVQNDAVHLLPYLGFLTTPSDDVFYHGFAQLDFAANGNRIEVVDTLAAAVDRGVITDQALLYLDLGVGYWWCRNPYACITGLASVVEFHYTTSLQSAGTFTTSPPVGLVRFGRLAEHLSMANVTMGLHAETAWATAVRIALVLPLSEQPNRVFDTELQVQLNWRY